MYESQIDLARVCVIMTLYYRSILIPLACIEMLRTVEGVGVEHNNLGIHFKTLYYYYFFLIPNLYVSVGSRCGSIGGTVQEHKSY